MITDVLEVEVVLYLYKVYYESRACAIAIPSGKPSHFSAI